ncbi:MAG: T9SS type A sorting domain-containing protein, partial [Bacteroidia bacterium]|nr:T9SS type A sorting domain-containing protein [Bacteroidia bacterium]
AKLYPNPIINDLIINNPANADLFIQLINMNGSIIKEEKINNSVRWDLSELSQGIYLVKVSDEKNSMTRKFVKQ